MFMEDKNNECCTLLCSCGCEGVIIKVDKDEISGSCELSLISDMYYINHESWWDRFKEKCKRILKIIRNKENEYFNIYIEAEDIKEFKDFVAKI